jgi:exodeoxyribonuclease V
MTITLTPDQQRAADTFIEFMQDSTQFEMVISGFPGTGKSTLTQYLLDFLPKYQKLVNVLMHGDSDTETTMYVTATTNKAAQVIANLVGTDPITIHSLLGIKVENDYKTGKTRLQKGRDFSIKENFLIIIDEASYIDRDLLRMIQESTLHCKILYIGDRYQLASAGEQDPPVFNLDVTRVELTQVMRNAGPIATLAGQYRTTIDTGEFQPIWANGVEIVQAAGPTFQALIDAEFTRPDRHIDDAKILAWTNNTVQRYNAYIRELNGYGDILEVGEQVITNKLIPGKDVDSSFKTDAHVRITQIGIPRAIEGIPGRDVTLNGKTKIFVPDDQADAKFYLKQLAARKEWRTYFEVKDSWGDLRPPYACTTHKSQGSTYKTVFINLEDIGRCNIASDVARMLNVAISRASQKVVLYGDLPEKYGGVTCSSQPSCLPLSAAS